MAVLPLPPFGEKTARLPVAPFSLLAIAAFRSANNNVSTGAAVQAVRGADLEPGLDDPFGSP